jgi:hypothetical protein
LLLLSIVSTYEITWHVYFTFYISSQFNNFPLPFSLTISFCWKYNLLAFQRLNINSIGQFYWLTWEVTYLVLHHINNYKYIFVKVTLEMYKPRIPRVEVKPHRWREEAIPQSTHGEMLLVSILSSTAIVMFFHKTNWQVIQSIAPFSYTTNPRMKHEQTLLSCGDAY